MPLHKKCAKGTDYVAFYVDDNLMVGNVKATEDAITTLKNNELVLKVMQRLQDYLSCKKISEDKKRAWLGQPHLIKNLEKKFGKCIQEFWSDKTPFMPKFLIARPTV